MFSLPDDYNDSSSDFLRNSTTFENTHSIFPRSSSSNYSDSLNLPFTNLSQPLKPDDYVLNQHNIIPIDIPTYLISNTGDIDPRSGINSDRGQRLEIIFSSASILDNISSAMASYDFNPLKTDKEEIVYDAKSSPGLDPTQSGISHSSYQATGNNQCTSAEYMRPPKSLEERPMSVDDQDKSSKSYKICQFDDCKTQASFKFVNEKKVRFCAKHKLPGMTDCRSKRCENPNCHVIASFNILGEKKRRFCKLHAEPGMEYVGSKRTRISAMEETDNLEKDETDDYQNDSTLDDAERINALLLQQIGIGDHDLLRGSGMSLLANNTHDSLPASMSEANVDSSCGAAQENSSINLSGDALLDPLSYLQYLIPINSSTEPEFSPPYLLQESFSATATDSMDKLHHHSYVPDTNHFAPISNAEKSDNSKANNLKKVNKRKICEAPNCQTQASFKFPEDSKFRFCAKHKVSGMADFHSRKCEQLGCEVIASFNVAGETKRRFCKAHALPGMQHIGTRKRKNNENDNDVSRAEQPPPVIGDSPALEVPKAGMGGAEAGITPSSNKGRCKKEKRRNTEDLLNTSTAIEKSSADHNSIPQTSLYMMDEMVLHHQHLPQQQQHQQQQQQYLAQLHQQQQQHMQHGDMNQMIQHCYQQQQEMHLHHSHHQHHHHHLQQQQQLQHHHHLQHHHLVDPGHQYEQHHHIQMQQPQDTQGFLLLDVLQQQHDHIPHQHQLQQQQLHHHLQQQQHHHHHHQQQQHQKQPKQVALLEQQQQLQQQIGDPQSHQLDLIFDDLNGPDNSNFQLNGEEFFYQIFNGDGTSDTVLSNNVIHAMTSLNGE